MEREAKIDAVLGWRSRIRTSRHTPPPWTAKPQGLYVAINAIDSLGPYMVAQVNSISDANLLAAAPDLLDVARRLKQAHERGLIHPTAALDLIPACYAAIDKAEGRKS